jgi:hypothetical protein
MKRSLMLALAASLLATAAFAQAPMSTAPAPDTVQPAQASAAALARLDEPTQSQIEAAQWGRDVLARARGELPPSDDRRPALDPRQQQAGARGCVRNPDRAPHGSAGVAVGSGGYRAADIFVTQPVGDCGQISVGISTSRGGRGYHGGGGYHGGYGPY